MQATQVFDKSTTCSSASNSNRRSSPNMFLAHRNDGPSSIQPPTSPTPTSPIGRFYIDNPNSLLQRQSSRGSKHKKQPSSGSDGHKSDHRRASSIFSASQFSSPATTISRPSTPDPFDFYHSESIYDLDRDCKNLQISRRPLSALASSTTISSSIKPSNSNRWSTSSSSLRHSISEQERLLQEKLQQLARSENARLMEFEKIVSTASSSPTSRPTSFISSSEKRSSAFVVTSPKLKLDQRKLSLQNFNSNNDESQPDSQPQAKPEKNSRDAARAAALATLSGGVTSQLSRHNSRKSDKKRRRSALNSQGYFIISDSDLAKLGRDARTETGPNRPGDIGGTVLSWRMAGDIIKAWVAACKSPESLFEILYFIWAMFSNPSNIRDINLMEFQWLPPAEIVLSLKENVTVAISQASVRNVLDSFAEIGKILGRGICTGFAFLVIFIQVSLLSVMVIAYILGDMLISPARFLKNQFYGKKVEPILEENEPALSPEEQSKATALKVQRAARKAVARRSKRRVRHHNQI